jgi:hypothetical protein
VNTVLTVGAFLRHDPFNYYPSDNPFADLAPDFQQETLSQDRRLTNAGLRTDISYSKGNHNFKAGATYQTCPSPKLKPPPLRAVSFAASRVFVQPVFQHK